MNYKGDDRKTCKETNATQLSTVNGTTDWFLSSQKSTFATAASGGRLYATTFASACRRLASAEVFSPMNLHCMKEQLDLWPSLRGWPSDTTPSQFTAGKALREKQAYAIWRIFWNLLLTKKHTSATLARRASVLGSYRYFHHWWLSAGTEGMASVY